jgi:hypothetical protein
MERPLSAMVSGNLYSPEFHITSHHFILPRSHGAVRVISGQDSQFVLEETYDAKENKHGVSSY